MSKPPRNPGDDAPEPGPPLKTPAQTASAGAANPKELAFTLTDAHGKVLSQTTAENASYAGVDTSGMALTLINEKADEVVAQLYSDYCRVGGS